MQKETKKSQQKLKAGAVGAKESHALDSCPNYFPNEIFSIFEYVAHLVYEIGHKSKEVLYLHETP